MAASLVIVTGGSSGIGRALLEAAPFPDLRRVDVSRRGTPDPEVEHVKADLADPRAWPEVATALERKVAGFGGERVVFVQNAGTLQPMGYAGEVDPLGYTRQVLLNSAAPQVLGDAFLRIAAHTAARCTLVVIGSGAARSVYEGWSAYGAGKAAVDQWVRTVGAEQERRGGRCRLVSIAPGVVATAMQAEIREMSERDFPEVERFVELHESFALRDAHEVAREIWDLVVRDDFQNGEVLDLRDRAAR